jgi:hypothetical protein
LGKTCGIHKKTKANTVLGAKYEGKGLHGKRRHRCEDNIKINVTGIRRQRMGRIHLASDKDKW